MPPSTFSVKSARHSENLSSCLRIAFAKALMYSLELRISFIFSSPLLASSGLISSATEGFTFTAAAALSSASSCSFFASRALRSSAISSSSFARASISACSAVSASGARAFPRSSFALSKSRISFISLLMINLL